VSANGWKRVFRKALQFLAGTSDGVAHICHPCARNISPVFAIVVSHFSKTGDRMPRYISQHTLACLTRQGAEQLSKRLHEGGQVTARRVLFNMQEGKMLAEFDAPGREELEKWLAAGKFHFDWLLRLEFESTAGSPLQPLP
jgi:hypothetical protein